MNRRTAARPRAASSYSPDTPKGSPTWHAWGIPLGIGLVTFVAFLPTLRNGFVSWDDQSNFLDNPYYRGLGPANLKWMWSTFLLGHYVPLSWMSLGLDYVLWGMNPAGYHFTSVVIHSVNAVLVYHLAVRVLGWNRAGDPTETKLLRMAGAIAALLFAVHPLRVESVAWVTERRDVLSGLFYLSTLLAYLTWVRLHARRWYWISVALFAAALLSKGTSVTLPAVLLVLNAYPLRRFNDGFASRVALRIYAELIPFFALAAGFVVVTFTALQSMPQLPLIQKVTVSAYSLVFYLWKTVAPSGLVPLYEMPANIDPLGARYIACYVAIAAVSLAVLVSARKRPGVLVAWLLFVGILLPLLGVHQNGPQIAADRYTYNAAPVLAILVAAGWMSLRRAMAPIVIGIAASIVAILAVATWRQATLWRDSSALWSAVLRSNPQSAIAWLEEGNLATKNGFPDSATAYYRRSLDIDPRSPETENNLGIALSQLGRLEEARTHFERATHLKASYYEAENNLGLTIANLGGDPAEAIAHYQAAISMKSDYADPRVNWGNALVQQGRFEEAIAQYRQALAIRPGNADAELNWGVALARENRFAEAAAHFEQALRLRPGFAAAQQMLDQAIALRDRPARRVGRQ